MPYSGDTYGLPAGTVGVSGALADVSHVNERFSDLEAAQNAVRPLTAGGTGQTTKAAYLGANLTAFEAFAPGFLDEYALIDPATISHRLIREIEITKGVDTPVATINEAIPTAFKTIQIIFDEFEGSVTDSVLSVRVGENGDAGPFIITASYVTQVVLGSGTSPQAGIATLQQHSLTGSISNAGQNLRGFGDATIQGLNQSGSNSKLTVLSGGATAALINQAVLRTSRCEQVGNYNGVQFFAFGGNIVNLRLKIYGVL